MKVGFFGGTFDPIHFGHLNLAIQLCEIHQLDQVLFCPTSLSPHKIKTKPIANDKHRKAMVKMAIEEISSFAFCGLELEKEEEYFTVDTIRALTKERPNDHFHLLLGEDSFINLDTWKEAKELIKLAPPLIGSRPGDRMAPSKGMTAIRNIDISSTYIRDRLKKKLYCKHLVPLNVLDYIYSNKLYFTS